MTEEKNKEVVEEAAEETSEDTVVEESSDDNGVAPKVTDVAPKVTDVAPKVTDVAPKVTDVVTKVTDVVTKVTDVVTKVTDVVPESTDAPKKKKKKEEAIEPAPELSSGHFYFTRQTVVWHAGEVAPESVISDGSVYFCRSNLPENAKPAPKGMKVIESDVIVDRLLSMAHIMFWGHDKYGTYTELSLVGTY